MSRASVVYLVMIVVLVGGLWAILAIGGQLSAPEDLRGRWTPAGPAAWPGLTVEQSGRYFELSFDGTAPFGVTAGASGDGGPLTLDRGPWHVTVEGETDVRTFRVAGPTAGTFTGRRATGAPPAPTTREAR
jgi:hypothetical protein